MKSTLAAFAMGCLLLLPGVSSALVIDNSASIDSDVRSFGALNTATYGQTFTTDVTETRLDDFSLFLDRRSGGAGSLNLRGYIASWTGLRADSILYTSATQTTNGNEGFTFAPDLLLLPNTTYVAFLSVSELAAQAASTFYMPSSNASSIAGGDFVYLNNGTNFGQLTSSNWNIGFPGASDVRFIANFSGVPEPATLTLLGLGIAGIGYQRRKRLTA